MRSEALTAILLATGQSSKYQLALGVEKLSTSKHQGEIVLKIAFAALAGLSLMAHAASAAQVSFRGTMCLTVVNQACLDEGLGGVGSCIDMRYTPANVGDNGPNARFVYGAGVASGDAESYTAQSGSLIGTTYQLVDGANIYRGLVTFTAKMRIRTQLPASLTTSNYTYITGGFQDGNGTVGCNFEFKAAGVRQ